MPPPQVGSVVDRLAIADTNILGAKAEAIGATYAGRWHFALLCPFESDGGFSVVGLRNQSYSRRLHRVVVAYMVCVLIDHQARPRLAPRSLWARTRMGMVWCWWSMRTWRRSCPALGQLKREEEGW